MSVKGQKYPAEPLTTEECRAILEACGSKSSTSLRNRALIVLLWRGGCRISEALALMPKDLEASGKLTILRGKGGKRRVVGLDAESVAVVRLWLERKKALKIKGPIISTLHGEPVQTAYCRNLLKRLAKKAGIQKRLHPHGLRHTYAVNLCEEGIPLTVVQKALGHSSLATTAVYVSHLGDQTVIDALTSRKWS